MLLEFPAHVPTDHRLRWLVLDRIAQRNATQCRATQSSAKQRKAAHSSIVASRKSQRHAFARERTGSPPSLRCAAVFVVVVVVFVVRGEWDGRTNCAPFQHSLTHSDVAHSNTREGEDHLVVMQNTETSHFDAGVRHALPPADSPTVTS